MPSEMENAGLLPDELLHSTITVKPSSIMRVVVEEKPG
jgi:hypothetical protein